MTAVQANLRLAALVALLLVVGGIAPTAALEPSLPRWPHAEAPAARLPACRYRDILTHFHLPRHWRKTLVDTNLRLRSSYRPKDLVSVSRAGIGGSGRVRALVIDDLRALARAARRAGKPIAVRSAYRSYAQQAAVFSSWVAKLGYERALLYSARPGHSEHQMGTTIDFRSATSDTPPWEYPDWGRTPAGRWMRRNAWRFGWVMSYPAGKRSEVCYGYEPWHWRYIGRKLAREVHDSGLTLRRFLWRRFESQ